MQVSNIGTGVEVEGSNLDVYINGFDIFLFVYFMFIRCLIRLKEFFCTCIASSSDVSDGDVHGGEAPPSESRS